MTDDADRGLRDEEDDNDLLSYGEVAARLQEEIDHLEAELSNLTEPTEVAAARARIEALRVRAARNTRNPLDGDRYEAFFGFKRGEGDKLV